MEGNGEIFEKRFHLKKNKTDVKIEVVTGVTTFMTMAYVLAINPSVLGAIGVDSGSVFTATALAALVATLLMAAFSNYPFVLASGMGLNAYFAYTVVLQMGCTWEMALATVFVEGLIFIVLSLTNVHEAIFNSIPMNLKHAVSVDIGLFIAFIGSQNARIVVDGATLVSVYSFKGALGDSTFNSVGITASLALIGILITTVLVVKNVKGNILWGILTTWILGMICQAIGLYVPNPELGMFSVFPGFPSGFGTKSMAPTFMHLDFSRVLSLDFLVIMFAFLFVDLFDTLETLVGVASKANMLDKDGKLPKIKGALMSDAIGTSVSAAFGTSTTTTFVESAAGVSEDGRTGLTAVATAALFGLSLFLSPIFLAIPSFVAAPALIVVGFLALTSITKTDFVDYMETIPAYICIITMPFMYSISEGTTMGVISYVVVNLVTGKFREKEISTFMYVLAVLFVLKYILI